MLTNKLVKNLLLYNLTSIRCLLEDYILKKSIPSTPRREDWLKAAMLLGDVMRTITSFSALHGGEEL